MNISEFINEAEEEFNLTKVDNEETVRADVLPLLKEKIAKLNKKSAALGVPPLDIKVTDTFTKKKNDGSPFGKTEQWHSIHITGHAPTIAGWHFMATIEHKEGGNVLRVVPGEENNPDIQKYYSANPNHCDHCNKNRRRNDTYIVKSDKGQLKQVGSNCLKAFLGGTDIRGILWYFSSIGTVSRIIDTVEHEYTQHSGNRNRFFVDVETVLTVGAAMIREFGYVSSKTSQETGKTSTAQKVRWVIFEADTNIKHSWSKESQDMYDKTIHASAQDKQAAKTAFAWFTALPTAEKESSEFMKNLTNILTSPQGISSRDVGFVVALFAIFERAKTAQPAASSNVPQQRTNAHVGKIGEQLPPTNMFVVSARTISTRIGTSIMHILRDEEGNDYRFFCNDRDKALTEGDEYIVTGIIKSHDDYKGQKSTMLSRVKAAQ